MAGGKERVLRRRIKSVQTTKKITKAMELIAASRIVKSQQRVLAARPYADQITEGLIRDTYGDDGFTALIDYLMGLQPEGGCVRLWTPAGEREHGGSRRWRSSPCRWRFASPQPPS